MFVGAKWTTSAQERVCLDPRQAAAVPDGSGGSSQVCYWQQLANLLGLSPASDGENIASPANRQVGADHHEESLDTKRPIRASRLMSSLHHLRQALNAGHQAEALDTLGQILKTRADRRRYAGSAGRGSGSCDRDFYGVISFSNL